MKTTFTISFEVTDDVKCGYLFVELAFRNHFASINSAKTWKI